ncbi:MAG TPA: iron ABC transporter permease [Stenomitos sp.]
MPILVQNLVHRQRRSRFGVSSYLTSTLFTRLYLSLVWLTAGLVSLPIFVVLGHLFAVSGATWQHLAQTVLPTYLANSVGLMLGVGLGTFGLGVGTAWFVALCQFPGRGIFEWALLLPLAVPAYVLAYVYTDFLDVAGPVQSALRQLLHVEVRQYWFPNIRSLGGAVIILTLALYPYVYMLAKVAFLEQSQNTLEASRVLGCRPRRSFRAIALPLARPSLIAGLSLVLMEVLSDFGTVQYFGVDTFTTGIYRTWAGMGDPIASTQLAAVLLVGILGLILLEQWSRGQAKYYQAGSGRASSFRFQMGGWQAAFAVGLCSTALILGFALPAGLLASMAIHNFVDTFDVQFWDFAGHSLILAIASAAITVLLATALAYSLRLYPTGPLGYAARVAAMGYAIPGSVIAVGISIPLGWLATSGNNWAYSLFHVQPRWVLSGTVGALIFAYVVRFLAISFNTVESNLAKIKPNLDDAARSLGCSPARTLAKVHMPIMMRGLLTALILAFVDVMKELPATLMIRPFNFDTLAIRVYRLASDERLAEASGPALAIVAVGLIPVLALSFKLSQKRQTLTSSLRDPQS